MKYQDKFGFLDVKEGYEFEGGKVEVDAEFDIARTWVRDCENSDGFLYPPQVKQVKVDPRTSEEIEDIPKTRRPALTHRLPCSHSIALDQELEKDVLRNTDAGFIIHLLGYLFGTRLQFIEWWHDGRVPIKSTHNMHTNKAAVEDFLSKSYKKYRLWNEEHRKWFLNILIMHSRAPSYEWDWERFSMEYMVFDGAYRLVSEIYCEKAKGHKDRFRLVFEKFNIPTNTNLVDQIYKLRNGLFHQALWNGGQPCTSSDAFHAQYHLSRINNRVIPALLGYRNNYVSTPWWSLGAGRFDEEK